MEETEQQGQEKDQADTDPSQHGQELHEDREEDTQLQEDFLDHPRPEEEHEVLCPHPGLLQRRKYHQRIQVGHQTQEDEKEITILSISLLFIMFPP